MINSIQDIESINDYDVKTIHIEQWNRDINIKPISGQARVKMLEITKPEPNSPQLQFDAQLYVISQGMVNDQGKLFIEPNDIQKLREKNPEALESIFVEILKVSGLRAEEVDEEEKKSETTQNTDS